MSLCGKVERFSIIFSYKPLEDCAPPKDPGGLHGLTVSSGPTVLHKSDSCCPARPIAHPHFNASPLSSRPPPAHSQADALGAKTVQ